MMRFAPLTEHERQQVRWVYMGILVLAVIALVLVL